MVDANRETEAFRDGLMEALTTELTELRSSTIRSGWFPQRSPARGAHER